jgi:hypothetical protein
MLQLLKVANLTTKSRTAVDRDYGSEVVNAHESEGAARFTKQLGQLMRGCIAVGMSRDRAMQLAIRCARDSIPPLRLTILLDVEKHSDSQIKDVTGRIDKPWNTVRRELQALHMLGMLSAQGEMKCSHENPFKKKYTPRYSLAPKIDRETLLAMADWNKSKRMEI